MGVTLGSQKDLDKLGCQHNDSEVEDVGGEEEEDEDITMSMNF